MKASIVVIDIGKSRSKLTLWREGEILRRVDRSNVVCVRGGLAQLDVEGIKSWLLASLAEFAAETDIEAIIPTAHGAGAVLLDGDKTVAAIDYETPTPSELASLYEGERDPFEATLSPRLPDGLNLGVQLFWLERLFPDLWPKGGRVCLWPQYWSAFLCGEVACEVTSLGCHSDLWRPAEGRFSDLALRRGWAERFGSLRRAGEALGVLRTPIAAETGVSPRCLVYCGLHDSNAALCAARSFPELVGRPFSVVSTGTWFVCLNADSDAQVRYDPRQDMLANVDVQGRSVPTARFKGGREYEAWMSDEAGTELRPGQLGRATDGLPNASLRAIQAVQDLARKTDFALQLVAAQGPILVEGRFAADDALGVALASLRPEQTIYRSAVADGVALGAMGLVSGGTHSLPALISVA